MIAMPEEKFIIRLFNVSKQYGKKEALKDLSLNIAENEFVFVTGPSGAGKSTMIKLLYRGEAVTSGDIIVNGQNLARMSRKQIPALRRRLGVIFQDFKLIPTRTVYHNVSLVLEVAGLKPAEIRPLVMEVLEYVGIDDRADELPPVLSGGEKQRVAVARAMVGAPRIVLADEPTGSLDPDSAARIFSLLEAVHRSGATVIVATHDQEMIRRHAVRVIRLENGRLVMPAQQD
jgi:cell division transport system ATP-binding protein